MRKSLNIRKGRLTVHYKLQKCRNCTNYVDRCRWHFTSSSRSTMATQLVTACRKYTFTLAYLTSNSSACFDIKTECRLAYNHTDTDGIIPTDLRQVDTSLLAIILKMASLSSFKRVRLPRSLISYLKGLSVCMYLNTSMSRFLYRANHNLHFLCQRVTS